MDWSKVASGGLSLLGSIGSAVFGSVQHNRQIAEQKRENSINRLFNSQQAQIARQYNSQMVNAQRAYDSPASLMSRLRAAGVHPALAYSNGMPPMDFGIGSTYMSSSSNGSIGVSPSDFGALSSIGSDLSNISLQTSQRDLNNAIRLLDERQLYWYDKRTEKELEVADSNIYVNNENAHLSGQKAVESAKNCALLEEKVLEVRSLVQKNWSEAKLYDAKTTVEKIEAAYRDKILNKTLDKLTAEINEKYSQVRLNNAQANSITQLLSYQQLALQAAAEKDDAAAEDYRKSAQKKYRETIEVVPQLARHLTLDGDKLEIHNDIDAKTGEAAAWAGIIGTLMQASASYINAVGNLVPF